jgi:sugar phosphate isomerase/epimerase
MLKDYAENVNVSFFEQLEENDVLFIDSSHVIKTGNDVKHLFLDVLPTLKKGVHIHIHDVFIPFEYGPNWVINQNRSYNEQYILQALLTYSSGFEFVFGTMYAANFHTALWTSTFPKVRDGGGGSIWIRRI